MEYEINKYNLTLHRGMPLFIIIFVYNTVTRYILNVILAGGCCALFLYKRNSQPSLISLSMEIIVYRHSGVSMELTDTAGHLKNSQIRNFKSLNDV